MTVLQSLLVVAIDRTGFESLSLTIGTNLGSCSHLVTVSLQGREGIQTTRGEQQVDFQQVEEVIVHKRYLQNNKSIMAD